MPTVLDWSPTVDPSDMVGVAREVLAAGSPMVLPGDCGYVVLINPLAPAAVGLLATLANSSAAVPAVLAWGPDDPHGLGLALPIGVRRLLSRGWPSPLVVAVAGQPEWPRDWSPEVQRLVGAEGQVRFRCPEHPIFDSIAPTLEFPVLVVDTFLPRPELVLDLLNDPTAVAVSAGTMPTDARPTAIVAEGPHWRITEKGMLPEDEVQKLAARIIMFVCTGNTCRSPLAECLAKKLLSEHLGCRVEELPGRGYWVVSAGVSASGGCPAAAESLAVAAEFGGDLASHESRLVNPQLLAAADEVIAMTHGHALTLEGRYPGIGPPPVLLCGDADLDDPIGAGLGVYRECARTILLHLERFLPGWVGS